MHAWHSGHATDGRVKELVESLQRLEVALPIPENGGVGHSVDESVF
jgi:hypothetical protein